MHSAQFHPILIVEDERIVAADLQNTLIEMGYDAYATVSCCADALSQATKKPPEIALMDIHIKGDRDGVETATMLRDRYGTAVIFLTAYADDATIQRAKESEPFGYLVKPVTNAMLKSAIEITLHRQAADQRRWREAAFSRNLEISTLVDQLQAAVLVEDELRRVQHANPRFCSIFCPSEHPDNIIRIHGDELMERSMHLFVEPQQFVARIDELVRARESVSGEMIRFADGRTFERDYTSMLNSKGMQAGHLWTYRDVTERIRNHEALEQSAVLDELTGLHNRRGFLLAAEHHLEKARRDDQQTVLLFLDLNGLKQVNDRFGHLAGDQALRDMAKVLRETFRDSDVLARLGGDEFVVLATLQPQDIAAVKGRLRQHLDELNSRSGRTYQLQTSIGAVVHTPYEALDALMTRADAAMYLEKRSSIDHS